MRIEAFSRGKDPAAPDGNEDALLVLPGRAYAVIDGATARRGDRYDGMSSGRHAAVLARSTLEGALAPGGVALDDGAGAIAAVTAAIRDAYRRHGIEDAAAADTNQRFSATLALVTTTPDAVHVWLVGDSGVRINGEWVLQVEKDLDVITSTLRQQAWPVIAARTPDPVERERLSRLVSFHGSRQDPAGLAPWLFPEDMAAVERLALAACAARLPHVPAPDVARLVRGGIVNAQGGYQNDPSAGLGYSCLDGFDVPMALVRAETLPRRDVHTLELFSDGYFRPADGFGVDAWEASFAEVERTDPAKVLHWLSPKGSTALQLADDRTYLGIRF